MSYNIFLRPANLNLTFDNVTSKTKGNIFSLGASTAQSLAFFKAKESKDMRDNICIKKKTKQFDLDHWQCDLNIKRGCLLYRCIHFTKFGSRQILIKIMFRACTLNKRNRLYFGTLSSKKKEKKITFKKNIYLYISKVRCLIFLLWNT